MWGYRDNMMGWGWLIGAVVVAVVVIVAVIVVLRLVPGRVSNPAFTGGSAASNAAAPRQILDERYARGDLTTEEYLERVKHVASA